LKEIKVYSTPACPYCKIAKEYFNSKGIDYQNFDVSSNKDALKEMITISGQMGVPVIVIDDEVVIGFDKNKIDSLLNL
jgi:glutaredoxin-like YruB-family protein